MLTTIEKALFLILALLTIYLATKAIFQLTQIIRRGHGRPDWQQVKKRALDVIFLKSIALEPTFRVRVMAGLLHGLVAWGFLFFLIVNLGDVLQGFLTDYEFLGSELLGDLYRLGADLFSFFVLIGMFALLLRRILRQRIFSFREHTLLHPKALRGIKRDSFIVGGFILLHIGSRILGESFHLASIGADSWQPFASMLSSLWHESPRSLLEIGRHAGWWGSLGSVLLFIPYFPKSKHLHIFMAPLNYLIRVDRSSIGQLDDLDFEDESIENFGASKLEELSYSSLIDGYACIMCNRCQDVCPAYETGKVLSPAALEINKRYFLNEQAVALATGQETSQSLLEFAIPPEAVWACTACGACNQVCPVGNEPMHDILEIRRHLVLMQNAFPEELQTTYRGMERTANPWNIPSSERMAWAEGLSVPTLGELPDADVLWWVGCAPATDPRAQKTAKALAKILNHAGVKFAVLGPEERCTGDPARRSGNEFVYSELATVNTSSLKSITPKRIVTTCPHCLHALRSEYSDLGSSFEIVHHSELLAELIEADRVKINEDEFAGRATFHDPCYLGRQNSILNPPRQVMDFLPLEMVEVPRAKAQSFCCGAGGAQMWKEEEAGDERVSENRLREVIGTGSETLAVGCPFCMIMLEDAAGSEGTSIDIRDLAELIADRLEDE